MKYKISKNKANNIISITYNNFKFFDINKICELLDIDDITIILDSVNIPKEAFERDFITNNFRMLSSDSFFAHNVTLLLKKTLDKIRANGNVWNILLIDGLYYYSDDKALMSCITKGEIRYFIDINLSENQVTILINTMRYKSNLNLKIRENL